MIGERGGSKDSCACVSKVVWQSQTCESVQITCIIYMPTERGAGRQTRHSCAGIPVRLKTSWPREWLCYLAAAASICECGINKRWLAMSLMTVGDCGGNCPHKQTRPPTEPHTRWQIFIWLLHHVSKLFGCVFSHMWTFF